MLNVYTTTPSGLRRRDVIARGALRLGSAPHVEVQLAGQGVAGEHVVVQERARFFIEDRGSSSGTWIDGKPLIGRFEPPEQFKLVLGGAGAEARFGLRLGTIEAREPGRGLREVSIRNYPFSIGSAEDDDLYVSAIDRRHVTLGRWFVPEIMVREKVEAIETALLPPGRAPWSSAEKYTVLAASEPREVPESANQRAAVELAHGMLHTPPIFARYTSAGALEVWSFVSEDLRSASVLCSGGRARPVTGRGESAAEVLRVLRPAIGDRPSFWEALAILPVPRANVQRTSSAVPGWRELIHDPRMIDGQLVFFVHTPDLERWSVAPDYSVRTQTIVESPRFGGAGG